MARVYPYAHAGRKAEDESPAMRLTQAAAEWHRITGAPRPHRATLARWCIRGCRGIRLLGERSGGQWYVTTGALLEFHRLTNVLPEHAVSRAAGPVRAAEIARSLVELDAILGGRSPT